MTADTTTPKIDDTDLELLRRLSYGQSYRQIGKALHLTAGSTRNRANRLFKRLDVGNAAEAVRWGFEESVLRHRVIDGKP